MRASSSAACAAVGVAALLVLVRCTVPGDPAPVISRTVDGVDGFELRHTGFGDARRKPGHFSLGYAIWANYPYIVYRGKEYRHAGPGSVFVRLAQGPAPRYIVEEFALDPDRNVDTPHSSLEIIDRSTGAVLGSRGLRSGQVENGHGWTGQHAAAFVRRVLRTPVPIGGPVGTTTDGSAAATVDALPDGDVPAAGDGCPSTYRLDQTLGDSGLDTGAWMFVPQLPVNSYACHEHYILTQEGWGNLLYLDLLTTDGRHVFQTELRTPVHQSATIALKRLRLSRNTSGNIELQVDLHYGAAKSAPARRFRATVQTGLN